MRIRIPRQESDGMVCIDAQWIRVCVCVCVSCVVNVGVGVGVGLINDM